VCEIKDAIGVNLYNVSRHLKELKQAGFVQGTKTGRWVYHALDRDPSPMHAAILNAILLLTDDLLALDAGRLRVRLRLRKEKRCVVGPAETLRQAQRKTSRKKGTSRDRRNL
jgi:DNA-binding transcriptional ArsR family regulator